MGNHDEIVSSIERAYTVIHEKLLATVSLCVRVRERNRDQRSGARRKGAEGMLRRMQCGHEEQMSRTECHADRWGIDEA